MGAAGARLVIRLSNGAHHTIGLPVGLVDVGRAPGSTIRLDEPEVSTRHAELAWSGDGLLRVRDLASTNGTYVNERRVGDWTVLGHGDRIRWGSVDGEVVLLGAGGPSAPTVPPTRRTPTPAAGSRSSTGSLSLRRVFISHASQDKHYAREVAAGLRGQRWIPWLDESEIRGGASWAASIQAALRAANVVVLLITANSVAKEWVLDEIAAARNLRVPIIAAVVEHVRLPDELQFLLQRTQFVDVSGLTAPTNEYQRRAGALHALDDAILGLMERRQQLNPDRVLMRIGRLLSVIGLVCVLVGFAGFIYSGFTAVSAREYGFPTMVLFFFALFGLGGLIAAFGGGMVRRGRAKGL
jgi:hypothetical protein